MSPEAWVVVDLGFGDAGKGSITDFLVRDRGADLVVRYNGGAQAGHNVVTADGRHHTFSQFGAGSFVDKCRTHLGPAFVVHPGGMAVEADRLTEIGVPDVWGRTTIDGRAHVISPFQQAAGRLRELLRGEGAHGTCGVGVGEAVADATSGLDDTISAFDLANEARLRGALERQQRRKCVELAAAERLVDPFSVTEWGLLNDPDAVDRTLETWRPIAQRMRVLSPEAGAALIADSERLVFEGAQGVLLDQTWGFHPHTTWSDCTSAGALELLRGLPHRVFTMGVLRTYATRHGAGPFPTWDRELDALIEPYNHGLGWQGRFRRGRLDAVLLRYALEVCGGVDGLALTCLDVFDGDRVINPCSGYDLDGELAGVRRDERDIVRTLVPGSADDLNDREQLGRILDWVMPVLDEVEPGELPAWVEAQLGCPVVLESRGRTAERKSWVGGSAPEVR